ncbi:hypothetical protein CVT26_010001 [Gymnopilus dilepis]|uniref:Uncharacterized protein n=1 Tax=Gymnopilus dilepis TaxID=231916 RepID=A0A409VL37_9AGAR|nr:hypothetical protein CVT26_010001 [Gymnopilus dilepis]
MSFYVGEARQDAESVATAHIPDNLPPLCLHQWSTFPNNVKGGRPGSRPFLQHWLSSVIQLYRAFVPPSSVAYCVEAYGMTPADLALLDLRDHYNVASSVFFVATMVIGDWFLIYRLFIVWSRNCLISIPPAILSIGALVSGSAVCYQFARADATVFVVAQNWITATFSLSVASNIYSTSLIAFKLIGPRQEYRFYGFRKRVFEVLVQSAALYCILAILVLSFSLASTNLVYIATSLTNPVIVSRFFN